MRQSEVSDPRWSFGRFGTRQEARLPSLATLILAPDVLLRSIVKRGELQNQSVTSETGNYFLVSMKKILPTCSGAVSFTQDPVVAPAGIDLRAGSTQRPLLDVVGPGIEHFTRTLTLERGIAI